MGDQGYTLPETPRASSMRADTPPPTSAGPKRKVSWNEKGKEKVKAAPRKVTKEAAAYGMEAAKALSKNPLSEAEEERIWNQIASYRRVFPELSHNYKINPDSAAKDKLGELKSVQSQLSDETAFKAAKLMLTTGCSMLALGNQMMPMHPVGEPAQINKLPMVMKDMVNGPEEFLNSELKELTILYPWLFRPGPELRVLLGIYQVVMQLRMPRMAAVDVSKLAEETEDL